MSFIKLITKWVDDDEMLNVELSVSNGLLTTTQDFYTYPERLRGFGNELENFFPSKGEGEVVYEYGSETENFYSFVMLRAFYINTSTIGLYVKTNNKQKDYELAISEFTIQTSLAEINRLGKKISKWSNDYNEPFDFKIQVA